MKTISNMGLPVTRPEGLSTGDVRGTDSKANVAAVSEVVATPSAQPGTSFEGSGASVQRSHFDANVSREHAPVGNLGVAALGEAEYQLLSDRLLAQLKPRLAEALSGIETWVTQSRQLPAFQVVADHTARAPAREADRLIEQNMRDVQRRVADINWSLAIVKDMLAGLGIDGKNVEASSPLVVALASAMKARASHATAYYQTAR